MSFVPEDFVVPLELVNVTFVLRPLAEEHNESDYDAWMSSVDHIRATPGFEGRSWPRPASLAENLRDIRQHMADFEARNGFTYTMLGAEGLHVLGCVYIYPGSAEGTASVRSWVRVTHAELDIELYKTVLAWLEDRWPFDRIGYAERR